MNEALRILQSGGNDHLRASLDALVARVMPLVELWDRELDQGLEDSLARIRQEVRMWTFGIAQRWVGAPNPSQVLMQMSVFMFDKTP